MKLSDFPPARCLVTGLWFDQIRRAIQRICQ